MRYRVDFLPPLLPRFSTFHLFDLLTLIREVHCYIVLVTLMIKYNKYQEGLILYKVHKNIAPKRMTTVIDCLIISQFYTYISQQTILILLSL